MAVLPQFAPPLLPGISMVLTSAGGVNNPRLRELATTSLNFATSFGSSKYGFTSSAVKVWRENGGGAVGNGCVGHDSSPGTSERGTLRSSTGQIGLPVTRSKTNTKPCLVVCATTSTSLPSCLTVSSLGA